MQRLFITILAVGLLFSVNTSIGFAAGSTGTINTSSYKAKVCHDSTCVTPVPGQINWRPTGAPAPVTISDTSGIEGYAWGDELGWINLNPSNGGLSLNSTTGEIVGLAWSATSGWINFSPTNGGVSINSSGEFTGWAWASGPQGGWVKFDCSDVNSCVKTDWLPLSARNSGGGGSNNGGGAPVLPALVYVPPPPERSKPTQTIPTKDIPAKTQENKDKGIIGSIVDKITGIFKKPTKTTPQVFVFDRQKTSVPIVRVTQILRLDTSELMCKEPLYPCPYFTKYQQQGDVGGDVAKIQKFLNTIYKNKQIKITGRYDEATVALVKKFQTEHSNTTLSVWGLAEPTGSWYQATRRAANELVGCYDPVLQIDVPTFTHQQ